MRWTTLICIVLLIMSGLGFEYHRNPEACARVFHDLVEMVRSNDVSASSKTPAPASATPAEPISSPLLPKENAATVEKLLADDSNSTPPPAAAVVAPKPASAPTASPVSTVPAWTAPAVIPKQDHWNWTTTDGKTYRDVTITKIEADAVTILHADGGCVVPISTLPPEIQKQLNYDPAAARAVQSAFASTDYDGGVDLARSTHRLLLLDFAGDWAPTSKAFEAEVVPSPLFQKYAGPQFVLVKLVTVQKTGASDPEVEKLIAQYHASVCPLLVVIKPDGTEVARVAGYEIGEGAQIMVNRLESALKH